MTLFEQLRKSGLPIDWAVIALAGQIIGPLNYSLSPDEIRDYALEQLPNVTPNQERAVIELAFVEDRDTWTVERCLEQLGSRAPEDIEHAQRIWRWILLADVITELEWRASHPPVPDAPEYVYWEWKDDIATKIYCDLQDFWSHFPFPATEFVGAVAEENDSWNLPGISGIESLMQEYRRWLTDEKTKLMFPASSRDNEAP